MSGVSQIIIEDDTVNAALDRVAKAGGDTAPLMQAFAGYMLFSVQRRFETETDPDGVKWKPLAKTKSAKGRANSQRKILRDTNRLYGSIVGDADAHKAIVGTNVIYASIHQEGGVIKKQARKSKIRLRTVKGRTRFAKKSHKRARDVNVNIGAHTITIPARPYLGFSEIDKTELLNIADDHYQATMAGGAS